MHALRLAHATLVPGGLLVVLHPFSAEPLVEAGDVSLGSLDAREFAGTVRATEVELQRTVADGLFAPEHEERFEVREHFAGADTFVEIVEDWQGTVIPRAVRAAVRRAKPPIQVRQPLVLFVYRAIA